MLALELKNTRDFMNKLLKSDLFDHFLLQEAVITSGVTYTVNGRINLGYYSSAETEELGITDCRFLPFSLLRGTFFDLIKGKKAPSAFRFIFLLSPQNLERTLESIGCGFTGQDVSALFLNIRYQNQLLSLTTGVSYTVFSPDRNLESGWDHMVKQFLIRHGISYEEL